MNRQLNNHLQKLTDEIVASYGADHRTQRVGRSFMPTRSAIVQTLEEMRQLLFPGYFGHKSLTENNISYHVGSLLTRIGQDLTEQINTCICSEAGTGPCPDPTGCRHRAEEITRTFLQRIPEIRERLSLDAQAFYDGDPAAKSIDEIVYSYPGFYAVTTYRLAHELLELGVPLMPRILSEHAHSVTGCDIHPGAKIGRSFFIDHATGVVIGETATIGDNVRIYQGVTLGAKSFPKDERGRVIKGLQRHPTIEDDVTIYPNATILGGQTVIGRGATIGGNVYLMESVPPDMLVKQEEPRLQVVSKAPKARATPG